MNAAKMKLGTSLRMNLSKPILLNRGNASSAKQALLGRQPE
ncbi:hypothetical protein A2U01_0089557, partial [Trifolium medium]|nr:hypothetical protein [Trifolium medium]